MRKVGRRRGRNERTKDKTKVKQMDYLMRKGELK